MTTNFQTLNFDIQNNVARITLNRPNAANSMNGQMGRELFEAAIQCDTNPDVRAVLITGAGRFFCAGGDLKEFTAQDDLPGHIRKLTTYLHAAITRFARMDAPTIAAVNGPAGGAGMSLACACDLVYVAQSASFTLAYTAVGLAPDGSSTYFLTRTIGLRRTLELALTNRRLSASEAVDWGIATRALTDDALLPEAIELAERLSAGPTKAYGVTRRLIHSAVTASLETQMEHETQAIVSMAGTADAKEGMAAFVEKRRPVFVGR